MAFDLPSFKFLRLQPPDAAGLERPRIVHSFSHTPVFLPMHSVSSVSEQKVNSWLDLLGKYL
jgi:hypothetical protein